VGTFPLPLNKSSSIDTHTNTHTFIVYSETISIVTACHFAAFLGNISDTWRHHPRLLACCVTSGS